MSLWEYFGCPEGAVAHERGNQAMVSAEPILHGGLIDEVYAVPLPETLTRTLTCL